MLPAFHFAFQSAGCNVTTFASTDGYNMRDATKTWHYETHNVSRVSDFLCDYDIFVFTTVEGSEDFRLIAIRNNIYLINHYYLQLSLACS